ncbi:MAG: alpha/beta hydrolase [Bacilli bacterium]|nr:alpha/beta hydrolase [Bacilli bacterium]
MWIAIIIVSSLIVLIFTLLFLFGAIAANLAMKRAPKEPDFFTLVKESGRPAVCEDFTFYTPKEKVTIKSDDGLTLAGYFMNNNSHNYVFCVHGYRTRWYKHTFFTDYYYNKGFNILFNCQRGHTDSEGDYITMGYKEKYDVIKWINWIIERDKDAKIILFGYSMGAATVLGASGHDLPSNVKCIIADSGYTSIYDECKSVFKERYKKLPVGFCIYGAYLYAKLFLKVDMKKDSMIENVSKTHIPMLFFHGTDDKMVNYKFIYKLYDAYKYDTKEMYVYEGSKHCKEIEDHRDDYIEKVENFVTKYF